MAERTTMQEIHESLDAHFHEVDDSGFGSMTLQPGFNGAGTIIMTHTQAKRLADAIYTNLGLTPL